MPQPDPEQVAFIERQPAHLTFTELAVLCRQQFGIPRAWSTGTIRAKWNQLFPHGRGSARARIGRDPEVRNFIRERADRLTIDQLRAALTLHFTPARVPSRTALHRFIQRDRRVTFGARPANA